MMTVSMMRTVVGALAVSLLIACASANPEIVEENVDLLDDNVIRCKEVHWKAAVDGSDFEFLPGQLPETDILQIVPKRCAEGEEVHITHESKPVDGPILLACQADKSVKFVGLGEKSPVESTTAFNVECVKPSPEAGDLLNGEGPEPVNYGGYPGDYPERRYIGGDGYPPREYQDPNYDPRYPEPEPYYRGDGYGYPPQQYQDLPYAPRYKRPAYGCKDDSHCEEFEHCVEAAYWIGECVAYECVEGDSDGVCGDDATCVEDDGKWMCEAIDCTDASECAVGSFCTKDKCTRFKNPYVPNYESIPYGREPYMSGPYGPGNEYGPYGGPYGGDNYGMYGQPSYGGPYGGDDHGMYGQPSYGGPYGGDDNYDGDYPNQQYYPNPYDMPYGNDDMPYWYKQEYEQALYGYPYPEYVDNMGYGGFGYYGYAPDAKCYEHKNNYAGMCGAGKYCSMNEICVMPEEGDYDHAKPSGMCMQDCSAYENFACTADYSPICGSDGETYSNICEFRRAHCGGYQYQEPQPYPEYNPFEQYMPYSQYQEPQPYSEYKPYPEYQQFQQPMPYSQYPNDYTNMEYQSYPNMDYQPYPGYPNGNGPYQGPYGGHQTLRIAHLGACDGYVSDPSDNYDDYNSTYEEPCLIKEKLSNLKLSNSLMVLSDDDGYVDGCATSITLKCSISCKSQLVLYKKDDYGVYQHEVSMTSVDFVAGTTPGPCDHNQDDEFYFLISTIENEFCISSAEFEEKYSLGCPKKRKSSSN